MQNLRENIFTDKAQLESTLALEISQKLEQEIKRNGEATLLVSALSVISKILYFYTMSSVLGKSINFLITPEGWLVGLISFSFLITASRLTANYFLRDRTSEKKSSNLWSRFSWNTASKCIRCK